MIYYGNNDYRDYLAHYGVLGMHWGIRRYQPYSVKPRESGLSGKEVGEARRIGSAKKSAGYYKRRLNALDKTQAKFLQAYERNANKADKYSYDVARRLGNPFANKEKTAALQAKAEEANAHANSFRNGLERGEAETNKLIAQAVADGYTITSTKVNRDALLGKRVVAGVLAGPIGVVGYSAAYKLLTGHSGIVEGNRFGVHETMEEALKEAQKPKGLFDKKDGSTTIFTNSSKEQESLQKQEAISERQKELGDWSNKVTDSVIKGETSPPPPAIKQPEIAFRESGMFERKQNAKTPEHNAKIELAAAAASSSFYPLSEKTYEKTLDKIASNINKSDCEAYAKAGAELAYYESKLSIPTNLSKTESADLTKKYENAYNNFDKVEQELVNKYRPDLKNDKIQVFNKRGKVNTYSSFVAVQQAYRKAASNHGIKYSDVAPREEGGIRDFFKGKNQAAPNASGTSLAKSNRSLLNDVMSKDLADVKNASSKSSSDWDALVKMSKNASRSSGANALSGANAIKNRTRAAKIRAQAMKNSGYSYKEIAKRLGIPESSVAYYLNG